MTRTEEFKRAVEQKGLKLVYIANRLGITYQGLRNKFTNKSQFTAEELAILWDVLDLSSADFKHIFLSTK